MPKPSSSESDKTLWSEFESITKMGLEALGYKVSKDVLLAGSQVDLYAELTEGLYVHRLIVECKDHAGGIGIEHIRQLYALVGSVSTEKTPVKALLVSRRGFTRTAKAYAESVNILLLKQDDLLRLSFDPFSIIDHILTSFDRDQLKQVYVDLSCQVNEGSPGTIYKPVEQFLETFLYKTRRSGVAILGNFGSGKTSLCKHYAYLTAKRFKSKDGNWFLPIYINLREVSDLMNLEEEILTILRNEYAAKVTPQGLSYWLVHRPTLLLLDGFDEMASRMDKIEVNKNVAHLLTFSNRYGIKLVLTCRTHFFKTEIEEEALGTMLRLYLRDWGSEELVEYVSKSLPTSIESSLKTIHSTYNLEELAKTPIFLNMITATIGEVEGIVNQARLYQVYTDRWIQNQDYRSKLSSVDKEMFMEEIAFEMFITGQSHVHHGSLPSKIRGLLQVQDYESLMKIDRDIRTCSFLIRDPAGEYQFVHRSYMEFFVAFKLAKEFKANALTNFSTRELSIEVAGFFANYFEFEDELGLIIRSLLGSAESVVRCNCALVLGRAGYNPETFSALALAIKTDKDQGVRLRAVDALCSFKEKNAILEIVRLAVAEDEIGLYSLRCLAPFMDDPDVEELCRRVLNSRQNNLRVRTVLENIDRARNNTLIPELVSFCKSGFWKKDTDLARALVGAIDASKDLNLILELERIERATTNSETAILIKQVKHDLVERFKGEVEQQARLLKTKGWTRPRNESSIRRKFRFLVDDPHFQQIIDGLYSVRIKSKRPSVRGLPRRGRTGSRRRGENAEATDRSGAGKK